MTASQTDQAGPTSADGVALFPTVAPSPDHPGWTTYDFPGSNRYNDAVIGSALVRVEDDRTCRVRYHPGIHLNNQMGQLHGGAILGMIDVGIFAALYFVVDHQTGGVTLDLATQFLAAGRGEIHTDIVLEVMRNTRNLVFVRGTVEQEPGVAIAAFSATIRKIDLAKGR